MLARFLLQALSSKLVSKKMTITNGIHLLPAGPVHGAHGNPADWADVFATFPAFSGIAKRRLRKLVRHATLAEYAPSDIVIQKGDPGHSLHVILAGSAMALGKTASR